VRDLAKSRAQVFVYLIVISSVTVTVMIKVRVTFNNSHMSRKSRTESYLAMRHIWHDTGSPWPRNQQSSQRSQLEMMARVPT